MKNVIVLESSCLESEKEPEEEESDIEEENSDEDIIDCKLTEQCDNTSTIPAPTVPDSVKRKLSPILEREFRPRKCKK